ncbi:MAG: GAF domain-containing sensor histidine kinase [Ardenticatenaceae bacterium]|nr:GAF domain-containing sensor histidine kinase [Ardenticatenaceae bacterium]
MVLQIALLYIILSAFQGGSFSPTMIITLVLSSLSLIALGFTSHTMADALEARVEQKGFAQIKEEVKRLETAVKLSKALQQMASTLRATQSFEQVMEQALDVSGLLFDESGIPSRSLVGAVFLYEGEKLRAVATRRFMPGDSEKDIEGVQGILGDAFNKAETTMTNTPRQDPELSQFVAFSNCSSVFCIPLRAGFQIFGAMVIGSATAVDFDKTQIELFSSVADLSVIALQNAQLYQNLEREKTRIITADEDARKELARDLHDGPTQTIAAIAMRLNFVRSLLKRDPDQAAVEIEKAEELAKQTSKEIRGMLFTLRPLVLETQGLSKAIETVMQKLRETDGLNVRLVGGQYGDMLSEQAQSVVFPIIEEALGNARKYSKASIIDIRMWNEDDLFVARVQDDGVGFDVEDVNKGYSTRGSLGLLNMQERAERIDGSLRLESEPGKGTKVTLVVPLNKNTRRRR